MKIPASLTVIIFFTVFLCLGLFISGDFGIGGDEIVDRNLGLMTYRYVSEGDPELLTYAYRYYGTAFEILLIIIEKALGLDDYREIMLMRHMATFLLFYISVVFFYLLCRRHFKSRKIGVLGSLLLILSPRIFAHSFHNSKDIAVLALFIISMYTLVRYLDEKTVRRAALHAFACAFLFDIRIVGVIIPLATSVFFFADMARKGETERGKRIMVFGLYMVMLALFAILLWPVLWRRPLFNVASAFRQMGHFPWSGTVLYFGRYIRADSLPWHYIPVWILLTTPLAYSFCFLAGVVASGRRLLTDPLRFYAAGRNELVFLFVFFLPLAGVILLGPVLYDGWRHMFFVYPAFLMIAMGGGKSFLEFNRARSWKWRRISSVLFVIAAASNMTAAAYFMVKAHPHQNVYFNALAGGMKKARMNFEMDYWGLSYRRALEYIARNDQSNNINVYISSLPGIIGNIPAMMLPSDDRKRFTFVDSPEEAGYFVTNYRWHREDYPYDELYSVEVNGAKIMTVYKL